MQIDRDAIMAAKEKLGDENARIIVEELGIVDYDERDINAAVRSIRKTTPRSSTIRKRSISGVLEPVPVVMTFWMC